MCNESSLSSGKLPNPRAAACQLATNTIRTLAERIASAVMARNIDNTPGERVVHVRNVEHPRQLQSASRNMSTHLDGYIVHKLLHLARLALGA